MREPGRGSHLSDEAVAAFADDKLAGGPGNRARRHIDECPDCAYAVAVQRQAVWALRTAPAPSLPTGLLDRLREVPVTTPIREVPSHVDPDGTAMFATMAAPSAAFVAPQREQSRRGRAVAIAAASVAVVGTITGFVVSDSHHAAAPSPHEPAHYVQQVIHQP